MPMLELSDHLFRVSGLKILASCGKHSRYKRKDTRSGSGRKHRKLGIQVESRIGPGKKTFFPLLARVSRISATIFSFSSSQGPEGPDRPPKSFGHGPGRGGINPSRKMALRGCIPSSIELFPPPWIPVSHGGSHQDQIRPGKPTKEVFHHSRRNPVSAIRRGFCLALRVWQ